jgi:adenylate cyclase class IV
VPSNIEIKARVKDPVGFRRIATELSDSRDVLQQDDTFFQCPKGRLKLRSFPDGSGQLIFYDRPDQPGPKESRYWISETANTDSLLLALRNALGIVGCVRKTRELFLVGQTRIHLDVVEGLGVFAELEVVMQDDQDAESGVLIATELMRELGIAEEDLMDAAYIDLLENRKANQALHSD